MSPFFIYLFVFIGSSILIASGFVNRINKKGGSKGKKGKGGSKGGSDGKWIAVGYWALVVFCLEVLFFPLTYLMGKELITHITQPSYSAEIVNYIAEDSTCEDEDGDEYACTKYTPFFKFTRENGEIKEMPGNIRSTSAPTLGKIVTVVLPEDSEQVHERSLRSIGLFTGAVVMLTIMGYFLILMTAYALGLNVEKLGKIGIWAAVNLLIPLAAGFMFCALAYVDYLYFFKGNPDGHPIWVVLICSFFCLMLIPLFLLFFSNWMQAVKGLMRGGVKNK